MSFAFAYTIIFTNDLKVAFIYTNMFSHVPSLALALALALRTALTVAIDATLAVAFYHGFDMLLAHALTPAPNHV